MITEEEWPGHDYIAAYRFNDKELDAFVTNFDYYARAELIARNITKEEYFEIERALKVLGEAKIKLSFKTFDILNQCYTCG